MATFMNIYISFFLEPICFVLQESRSSHNFSGISMLARVLKHVKFWTWNSMNVDVLLRSLIRSKS
ncbi:unnamed protein product [Albugo candida]|uniref:Uncharacterized protein n=1 Tax=Albugo candida TaxID=65357 RepID=A0A024GAN9_9STRA|nr:unnamed protein product [Albugo candida]|eukprot:CCI43896.1 unnamed protein product [Albugo candida]